MRRCVVKRSIILSVAICIVGFAPALSQDVHVEVSRNTFSQFASYNIEADFHGLKLGMTPSELKEALYRDGFSLINESEGVIVSCNEKTMEKVKINGNDFVSGLIMEKSSGGKNSRVDSGFTSHQAGNGLGYIKFNYQYSREGQPIFQEILKTYTDKYGEYSSAKNLERGVRVSWFWEKGETVQRRSAKSTFMEVVFIGEGERVDSVIETISDPVMSKADDYDVNSRSKICRSAEEKMLQSGSAPLRLP